MFDFELTFTGLCVLMYKGSDPTKPSGVSVVLTQASKHKGHHKHLPYLSYNPKDLDSQSTTAKLHRLVPTPSGKDIALLELAGLIKIDDPTQSGFSASWEKSGPKPGPGEETSLAWLPSIYGINSTKVPKPDPSKPNLGLINEVAKVELAGGVLESGDLTRNGAGDYVSADFVYKDGSGTGTDSQVLADTLRLKISALKEPVEISHANWKARLRPAPLPGNPGGTGRVEVSITNLPEIPDLTPGPRLIHFDHFYDMFSWPPGQRPDLRLPRIGLTVTGSSLLCPPSRYP